MRRNCKNFLEWAVSQFKEYCSVANKGVHLYASVHGTLHSVVANITNERTGKLGHISVKSDKFDDPTVIAIGLAWANYKHEEIPNFTTISTKLPR